MPNISSPTSYLRLVMVCGHFLNTGLHNVSTIYRVLNRIKERIAREILKMTNRLFFKCTYSAIKPLGDQDISTNNLRTLGPLHTRLFLPNSDLIGTHSCLLTGLPSTYSFLIVPFCSWFLRGDLYLRRNENIRRICFALVSFIAFKIIYEGIWS